MKGYELIKAMSEGKVKEHTKIKVWFCNNLIDTLECIEGGLKWQPGGRFDTSYLCDDMTEFEIIEEDKPIESENEIENLEELGIKIGQMYKELIRGIIKGFEEEK